MQYQSYDEPYGRNHLEPAYPPYNSADRRSPGHNHGYDYSHPTSPYYDDVSHSSSSSSRTQNNNHPRPYPSHAAAVSGSRNPQHFDAPVPPRHGDYDYYNRGAFPPSANDGMTETAAGMTGMAHNTANHSSRQGAYDHIPPPPSRAHYPNPSRQPQPQYNGGGGGYAYDPYGDRGPNDRDSYSGLNPFGTPPGTHSPARSLHSFGRPDSYADDPYQAYSSNNPRHGGANLGQVDPNAIEDDGDDGLIYKKQSQRSSILAGLMSDRGAKPAAIAVAGPGAKNGGNGYDAGADQKEPSAWLAKQSGRSKKCKWITIVLVFLVIAGAIAGGVVGSLIIGNKNKGKEGPGAGSGESAEEDTKANGDLNINSPEIKSLLNNPNLHKVFSGMDYTPLNSQYPDCLTNPPSQNNITRDVAVLSQLTNKLRLYGTDCNQTEMVIHALGQLKLSQDIKIWLGVWQDKNETTNARQLQQMWKILDEYGAAPFEGIIVANEILFRKEMTISSLAKILGDVRTQLAAKQINLPVATSDLGDDWSSELAADSDYIMANIHPFFAGVSAEQAAAWTWNFWEGRDGQFWKTDKNKNVISETGWPSEGGKHCGSSKTMTCEPGAVASIPNMNRFMQDWVCQALQNGTQYFWFEAFDEPWKIRFNEPGKEWEDKWGLMDINRKLKDGIKIPDCGGKTV